MLEAILVALLPELASPVLRLAMKAFSQLSSKSPRPDIDHEFDELRRELACMLYFLRTEGSKAQEAARDNWAEQVREVAHKIEDMIDEALYCSMGQALGISCKQKSSNLINVQLPRIKAEINNLSKRKGQYQVEPNERYCSSGGSTRTWEFRDELPYDTTGNDIVGMRENEDLIITWLRHNPPRDHSSGPKGMVISICGMGGLGKTTLARRVYNNQQVKKLFDCYVWLSVSRTYRKEEVLRSIIRQVHPDNKQNVHNDERSTRETLISMINQCLGDKRYLIVLDDVWSNNIWNDLLFIFQNAKFGSRVILTSRDQEVASSLSIDSYIRHLEPLSAPEAWSLFCKKAFWRDDHGSCPTNLQHWAQAIVAKCGGLPLAIVSIGSLLSLKDRMPLTWKNFYNSIGTELINNELLGGMSHILMLSYDNLPYHLRRCFLYCSIFPEDHVIKKNLLIRLWIAEGFVEERHGLTLEEVAEDYLKELIIRNMLQVAKKDGSGRVKACRMHDLMREIALSESRREKLFTVLGEQGTTVDAKARRLSIQAIVEESQLCSEVSCLRSLLFFSSVPPSCRFALCRMFSDLQLLRVLDLRGARINFVPDFIFNLFNLRYLSLRDTYTGDHLESIEKLQMLETLDLRNAKISFLPHEVVKLGKIRHLFIDGIDTQRRTSWFRSTKSRSWVWDMTSLQTLKTIEANDMIVAELIALVQLRSLAIKNVCEGHGHALCRSISKMNHLLRLKVEAQANEELALYSLSSPPRDLQKLVLHGRLQKMLPWVSLLGSLTHMYLLNCQLSSDDNPIRYLEQLASLVHLTLQRAYKGKHLNFKAQSFLHLKSLYVEGLTNLVSFNIETGSLPRLLVLYLCRCGQLKKGIVQHIDNLPMLQDLYLQEMHSSIVVSLRGDHRLKRGTGWKSVAESMSWL